MLRFGECDGEMGTGESILFDCFLSCIVSSSSELIFSIPPLTGLFGAGGRGGSGGGVEEVSTGGNGGAFSSGGKGGCEIADDVKNVFFDFEPSTAGLKSVECVRSEIPESMLEGVQALVALLLKLGEPNPMDGEDSEGVQDVLKIEKG